jgi:malic enzyme
MAIAAAKALADYAVTNHFDTENILPKMTDTDVFAFVAEAVAQQAIADGVATIHFQPGEVKDITLNSILKTRKLVDKMMADGDIETPSIEMLNSVLNKVILAISE